MSKEMDGFNRKKIQKMKLLRAKQEAVSAQLEEQQRINLVFNEILARFEIMREAVESGQLMPSGSEGLYVYFNTLIYPLFTKL